MANSHVVDILKLSGLLTSRIVVYKEYNMTYTSTMTNVFIACALI